MMQVFYEIWDFKDIIKELVRKGAETPPLNDTPARHYININLRIIKNTHILSNK